MKKAIFSALALAAAMTAAPLSGAMRAFDNELPSFSGSARQTKEKITRDGLGRRVKPKSHPDHNANNRPWMTSRQKFKAKVEATHSFNEDPRDDKYLHSHARKMRGLRAAFAERAA